jgi:hypothetical protein
MFRMLSRPSQFVKATDSDIPENQKTCFMVFFIGRGNGEREVRLSSRRLDPLERQDLFGIEEAAAKTFGEFTALHRETEIVGFGLLL